MASLSWPGWAELSRRWGGEEYNRLHCRLQLCHPLLHWPARRLALQGIRAPPEGPFCFWLEPHWQGKLLLLLREAVSCCCCCPVFATNPGLAALSGPHCSLRRPRPPLPHSPCTEGGREGGVGKTCLSSPASPPPPFPSQGCWERLRRVCRGLHGAGRPACRRACANLQARPASTWQPA